jgi:ankyrin repeat protein
LPVVELLLERRADVNGRDYSNKAALYYAAINEHADIAALLKKSGAKE